MYTVKYTPFIAAMHMYTRCIRMYGVNSHQAKRMLYVLQQRAYAMQYPEFA